MNQTTISPKENVTLLLVAVPKDAFDFELQCAFCKELHWTMPSFNDFNGMSDNDFINLISPTGESKFMGTLVKCTIIGLSSNITEEQAKELVNEIYTIGADGDYDMYEGGIYEGGINVYITVKGALLSLIESSDLTIGKDQDRLILKIN